MTAAGTRRRTRRNGARERVLATAYDLFRREGTRHVGVDTIIDRAGVAKMSLYRHFRSKEELINAFMERREAVWTVDWLKAEVLRRAAEPAERLLAIFDVFSEWFGSGAFDGCSFINILLEYPLGHPIHDRAAAHLANIRSILKEFAGAAGIADTQAFADTWHIMMKGSIVAACEGNHDAAREAKVAARLFLASCLPPVPASPEGPVAGTPGSR